MVGSWLALCGIIFLALVRCDFVAYEGGKDNFAVRTAEVQFSLSNVPKVIHLSAQQVVSLVAESPPSPEQFLIFEAHAREVSVVMYQAGKEGSAAANSTSPAVLVPPSQPARALLANINEANITVLASVRSYLWSGPVPGRDLPGLVLSNSADILEVSFSPATTTTTTDRYSSEFKYDVYEYFLPESDCTEEQFELAYQQFTSLEDLVAIGNHVTTLGQNISSFRLAAYPAVGRIVGLVVSGRSINSSSDSDMSTMYGLAHAYGCRLTADGPRGCEEIYSAPTWLICAVGIFAGSLLALAGHRFFKCSQVIFGFYLGSVVAYAAISASFVLDDILILGLAGLAGLVSSTANLAVWWFLGIPVISVLLPLLELGFLTACAFMSLPLKLGAVFASDTTYWLTFGCIGLVPTILLIAFTQKASIISCAVVGMATVIYCIDYFTRSSLKYVILDVVRRATVPDFGSVILAGAPFEKTDLFLLTCLLAGILLSLVCQLVMERTKPPFPPSPYQLYRWHRIPSTDREQQQQEEENERSREYEPSASFGTTEETVSARPRASGVIAAAAPAPVVGYILRHTGAGSAPSPRPWGSNSAGGSGHQGSGGRKRDIFDPATATTS